MSMIEWQKHFWHGTCTPVNLCIKVTPITLAEKCTTTCVTFRAYLLNLNNIFHYYFSQLEWFHKIMFDNIWNIFLNLTSFHEDQYFGSKKEVSNNYRMEWLQIIQTMKSFPGYKGGDIAEKVHNACKHESIF